MYLKKTLNWETKYILYGYESEKLKEGVMQWKIEDL